MKFLPVEWHDSLPSTNRYLEEKILKLEPLPSGVVVAAREQTQGKGRYQRKWISGKDKNLAFSFVMQSGLNNGRMSSLTPACAIAVAKVLHTYRLNAVTKWPNDILVHNKKICGILSRQIPKRGSESSYLIIGIGVNVNMTDLEAMNIDRPVTSIRIETGQTPSLSTLLEQILDELSVWITTWEQEGFAGIRAEWERLHKPIGTPMTVHEIGQRLEGVLVGFGDYGELHLQGGDGRVHTVLQGDVVYDDSQ